MLRLRCSSRLPNSRLPVRRLCSRGRCGSDRIVRTDSVYLGTAVTRQNFAPVVIASRCCPVLFCLDAKCSRANKYTCGCKYSESCYAYLSSVFSCSSRNFRYPNDFNSHSQIWFLSDIIAVRYAIGTMLTNAEFERPVRGTPARVATSSVACSKR